MNPVSSQLIVVFPITTSAFGLRADWFETFAPKFVTPSFLLITLLLVISIGVMALRRFEDADFGKKLWNLPILLAIIIFWPTLVIGLKELVDTFNTFLVVSVFGIPWQGFGFPEMGSVANIVAWPTTGLARLLPNLAYWIIYAFYLVFFFFYAVLGPLVLAKGVLFDEVEGFFELVREFVILLLWQTTLIVLVAFIMPSIVSGKPFPIQPEANFYFLSIILGIMILFVPSLTRKFSAHLESAFVPLGFRWGGAMLGLGAIKGLGGMAASRAGMSFEGLEKLKPFSSGILKAEEFFARYGRQRAAQDRDEENRELEGKVREYQDEERSEQKASKDLTQTQNVASNRFLDLTKKAKQEMDDHDKPKG